MTSFSMKQAWQPLRRPRTWLTASIFAGLLGVVGLPASWGSSQAFLVTQAAIAQTEVTADEITQYARSVLEIDGYRAEAYTEIKDLLLSVNADIGEFNMSCSDTQEISKVPRSVRRKVEEILVSYCNQAQTIVEDNGLTSRRFNEITSAHQQDAVLSERIQQALIRLQQP